MKNTTKRLIIPTSNKTAGTKHWTLGSDRMIIAEGIYAYHFKAGSTIKQRQAIVDQHNINLLLGVSDDDYNNSL